MISKASLMLSCKGGERVSLSVNVHPLYECPGQFLDLVWVVSRVRKCITGVPQRSPPSPLFHGVCVNFVM